MRLLMVTLLLVAAALPLLAQEGGPTVLSGALIERCHEVAAALDRLIEAEGSVADPTARDARIVKLRSLLDPLHAEVRELADSGRASSLHPDARATLAALILPIVECWIDLAAPRNRPSDLGASYPAFATILAAHDGARERRRFLNRIVDRECTRDGTSDLDLLCTTVAWDALFLRDLATGPRQLRALSADLILLFTERGPDGLRLSEAGFYRPGRTRDRGFRASLRDGGDQVRHFCWALRMFATSLVPALTEQVLRAKELKDASQRGGGENASDLRLNRTAREIVAEILGVARPESAGATPTRPTPLPIGDYAALFRQRLGPAAVTGR